MWRSCFCRCFAKRICTVAKEADGVAITVLTNGQLWAWVHNKVHYNPWGTGIRKELEFSVLVLSSMSGTI